MDALTGALALLAAVGNGAASVLQRRAAVEQKDEDAHHPFSGTRARRLVHELLALLRRRYWLAGFGAMVLAAAFQAGALTVGELSVVQPLLASELLFTLLLGSLVFRHRPGVLTWLSFLMLAVGLGLFMFGASPSGGDATSDASHWLPVGAGLAVAVAGLTILANTVRGTPRATVLGAVTAVGFACTAALIKEVTGRIPDGASAVFASGYLYATGAVGLLSFLVLQSTLRAGTLAASQPALTLGDALVSVILGWALFGERIALGDRPLAGVLGALLIAAGTTGLARSPAVHGEWDTVQGGARAISRGPRRGLHVRLRARLRPQPTRRRRPRRGGWWRRWRR
ncbi:DMT family transporter [Streptomyces sp. TS71-3]|uniref:DMT family transporter n=1 Tax=Streptomyces sp. TS71-3 TaxID=2733862 RepID=UPI001B1BFEA5|nr:DMT family transporter [Streptomyces sp. TS71-3]GHJ42543.1 membrane protein [Streptomyces sp. TS71-3]